MLTLTCADGSFKLQGHDDVCMPGTLMVLGRFSAAIRLLGMPSQLGHVDGSASHYRLPACCHFFARAQIPQLIGNLNDMHELAHHSANQMNLPWSF